MTTDEQIRTLAKTNNYQLLYMHLKEGSIQIFENHSNYTSYQLLFLNYLNYYHSLFTDIAMEYVPALVLNNFIFEDAYSLYKSSKKGDLSSAPTKDSKTKESLSGNSFTWLHKSKSKEGK